MTGMAANIIPMQDGDFTIAGNAGILDGDFVAVGAALHPSTNSFLLRTDASGDIASIKIYVGTGKGQITSLAATQDGGMMLVGTYSGAADHDFANATPHGDFDLFLINTDVAGNVRWGKLYGGKQYDGGTHIVATADGGYAFLGTSSSPTKRYFFMIIIFD